MIVCHDQNGLFSQSVPLASLTAVKSLPRLILPPWVQIFPGDDDGGSLSYVNRTRTGRAYLCSYLILERCARKINPLPGGVLTLPFSYAHPIAVGPGPNVCTIVTGCARTTPPPLAVRLLPFSYTHGLP